MLKKPFENIWCRIVNHEGRIFHTKNNKEFRYKIKGDLFYPSRYPSGAKYAISKNDFKKAYQMVPRESTDWGPCVRVQGPLGVHDDYIRGPGYVWAVLHDRRISQGEW